MAENIDEELDDIEVVDVPESADESAQQPKKKLWGKPFTKENAKQMALSAAKAKRMRKQARMDMLASMCTKLNLGEELVNAIRTNDETKMNIVEKALKICGLTHDQSNEALAARFEVKNDTHLSGNVDNKLEVIISETKPKQTK